MSSPFRRALPARPDLEQQKKLAKELLARVSRRRRQRRSRAFGPSCPTGRASADRCAVRARARVRIRELGAQLASAHRHPSRRASSRRSSNSSARSTTATRSALRALLSACATCAVDHRRRRSSASTRRRSSPLATRRRRRSTCSSSSALIRTDGATGGRAAFIHCTARAAVAERLLAAGAIPDACAAANLDRSTCSSRCSPRTRRACTSAAAMARRHCTSRALVRVADLLLERGADIDARDIDHRSTAAEWMLGDVDTPRIAARRWRDISSSAARRATSSSRPRSASPTARAPCSRRIASLLDCARPRRIRRRSRRAAITSISGRSAPNLTPLQVASKFRQQETLNAMERSRRRSSGCCSRVIDGDGDEARAIVATHPGIVDGLDARRPPRARPTKRGLRTRRRWS